ncbi:hypothetical protein [Campylobacter californiensis]|uniref:hypothetical protein n=1 Tax=Campylobacter californiensis TaxID=1032243 RepID=UPI00147270A9|nr:hypothetical protein [Campylobacter sp. RM12916]MBE3609211.1 hypothetical protein [Campylobacter sp. RM12916]
MNSLDEDLFKNILLFINDKINDVEFILFLILGICSLIIKKYITDSVAQSENIFINTQKENLDNLNQIYFCLVQLSLKPNSKSNAKKLYKLLLKNSYIVDIKENNDLLKNVYENYSKDKPLNEKLIFDYLRKIQDKIKEINNIINKNNSRYLEQQNNPVKFYLKKASFSLFLIIFILLILYVLRSLYVDLFT